MPKQIELSDEKIDLYGKALERWANFHHQQIYIDGKEILFYEPPSGGWGHLYWEYPYGIDKKAILERQRKNLRDLITNSVCNCLDLDTFFITLNNTPELSLKEISPDKLSSHLQCLGKVEIKPLKFSAD